MVIVSLLYGKCGFEHASLLILLSLRSHVLQSSLKLKASYLNS